MATVKYVLQLDDQLSKGLKSTAANVHAVVAALRELDAQAAGAGNAMAGASRATQVTAEQAKDAAQALEEMAKTAGLTAEQSAKLTEASKKASAAAKAQTEATRLKREEQKRAREEAKAAAAAAREKAKQEADAAKAAAKAAKEEERERQKLIRALNKQREADERVRLGKEQAQAVQQLRLIDQLIAKMREQNSVSQAEIDLLERRKAQIRENLAIETARARQLGTRIDRGFGATGTRRSPIAGGVFSTHVGRGLEGIKSVNAALAENAKQSTVAASAARNLAQQLPDVVAQLAAGANPSQVFAQQGLQVAQSMEVQTGAFTRLGSALLRSGPLLAGLSIGIAAVGAAAAVYGNQMEKAADATGRLNDRIDAGVTRMRKYAERVKEARKVVMDLDKQLQDARLSADEAEGLITPENAEFQRKQAALLEQVAEAQRDLNLAEKEAAETKAKIKGLNVRELQNLKALGKATEEQIARLDEYEEARRKEAEARRVLNNLTSKTNEILDEEGRRLTANAEKRGKAGETTGTTATGSAAREADKRDREEERRERERLAALDRLAAMARQAETSQLDGIAAVNAEMKDQLALIDKIAEGFGDLDREETAAIGKARDAVKADAAAKVAKIEADKRDAANEEAAKAAIAAQEAAQGLKEALDLLSGEIRRDGLKSLVGGDVSGAIEAGLGQALKLAGKGATAAGAAGAGFGLELAAAVVPAAVGLKAVGEMGADGVQDLAEQTVDAIVAGIEALPEILVRVAPKLGIAIATEIVPALLKLPYLFAIALGEAIRDLFAGGRERRQERRERRQERRAEARSRRSFRSGTSIVQRDGPAMLHQGELVVPVTGTVSQDAAHRVRRQAEAEGGGGGVRIRPVTIDAIVMGISSPQATGPWSHWAGYGPKIGGHR